jgi:hypothetical protein
MATATGHYNPYLNLGGQGQALPVQGPDWNKRFGPNGNEGTVGNGGQAGAGNKGFMGMSKDQAIGTGISAVGGLADAMSKQASDPGDFSIDPMAGITGSAKGFATGGPWGAIIGGALAQLQTFNKVHSNLKDLQDNVNTTQRDAYGRPMYAGADVVTGQRNINALRKGLKATHTGLSGSTHVISWIRGTGKALRRKQKRLRESIQAGQQDFNNQSAAASQQELAMQQYQGMQNKGNRMRSLYNIGNQSLY